MATTKWVLAAVVILGWMLATTTRAQDERTTTNGAAATEDESQDEIMRRYEERGSDEYCSNGVTGQFWYRVRVAYTIIESEPRERTVWRTCWVYDPTTCSNVRKRYRDTETYNVDVKKTAHRIEMRCARIELPWHKVKGQPHCDCDDLPVPYRGENADYTSQRPVVGGMKHSTSRPASNGATRSTYATTNVVNRPVGSTSSYATTPGVTYSSTPACTTMLYPTTTAPMVPVVPWTGSYVPVTTYGY